jgi:hypothetical protein
VGISLDGKQLTFLIHVEPSGSETAHQTKIVLLNLESGANPATKIVKPDQRIGGPAEFAPDGKAVVYPIREAGVDTLWLQPLDGVAGHPITKFTADLIEAYHLVARRQTPGRMATARRLGRGVIAGQGSGSRAIEVANRSFPGPFASLPEGLASC